MINRVVTAGMECVVDVVTKSTDQVSVARALTHRSMTLSLQGVNLAIAPLSRSQEKKGARDGEVRRGSGEGLGREVRDLDLGVEDQDPDQGQGGEDLGLGLEG